MLPRQWASFNHAQLECADAMSAFLEGDGKKMQETEDLYARALWTKSRVPRTSPWDPQ